MISISAPPKISGTITLPVSKSLANRLLILQALQNGAIAEPLLSDAEDILVLKKALRTIASTQQAELNIAHAGTAMRFLTAYLSQKPGEWVLTGSSRMMERPIAPLVDALRKLGADIRYQKKEGFPPLQISGRKLKSQRVQLPSDVSSQFITAMLLIAPFVEGGLELQLSGQTVSQPYIEMTLSLLKKAGVSFKRDGALVTIGEGLTQTVKEIVLEADWTASSYFFSICALCPGTAIRLKGLSDQSFQGDSVLPKLYSSLGVESHWDGGDLLIRQLGKSTKAFAANFIDCPDLAQTLMVTCLGLGITGRFEGLQTLSLKETDRIKAMAQELSKCGAEVRTGEDFLEILAVNKISENSPVIATYSDHRMAMAFAPLSAIIPGIVIKEEQVVNKSYPAFWQHLISLGFNVNLQPE